MSFGVESLWAGQKPLGLTKCGYKTQNSAERSSQNARSRALDKASSQSTHLRTSGPPTCSEDS